MNRDFKKTKPLIRKQQTVYSGKCKPIRRNLHTKASTDGKDMTKDIQYTIENGSLKK